MSFQFLSLRLHTIPETCLQIWCSLGFTVTVQVCVLHCALHLLTPVGFPASILDPSCSFLRWSKHFLHLTLVKNHKAVSLWRKETFSSTSHASDLTGSTTLVVFHTRRKYTYLCLHLNVCSEIHGWECVYTFAVNIYVQACLLCMLTYFCTGGMTKQPILFLLSLYLRSVFACAWTKTTNKVLNRNHYHH